MKSQLLVYAVVQQSPAHSVLLSVSHQSVPSALLVTLIHADVYVQTHIAWEETALHAAYRSRGQCRFVSKQS